MEQLQGILTDTDANFRFAKANYKKFLDKTVKINTRFKHGEEVLVDRLTAEIQLITDTENSPASASQQNGLVNKLLPQSK